MAKAFKSLLRAELKGELKAWFALLPSGFQAIGDVAILSLKRELEPWKAQIAKTLLKLFPRFKTCCIKKGVIKGKLRQPQLEVVAGSKDTETIHKEAGCLFKLDPLKVMWAKGNLHERQRIAGQVKPDETVVDMFAGIGYFSIPIAKHGKPKKVYAIELNPVAFNYLKENLELNKIKNVEAIQGDCQEEVPRLVEKGIRADRVIMGLLPPPKTYLPTALSIVKSSGIIHYENLVKEGEGYEKTLKELTKEAKKFNFKVKLLHAQKVKSYAPHIFHYTFDVQLLKCN